GIMSLAISSDSKLLASAGTDHTVRIWNVADGACRYVLKDHQGNVTSIAFAPGGKMFASASLDQTARIWVTQTGKPICLLDGHRAGVLSVAWSHDGKTLATSAADGTIRLWGTDGAAGRQFKDQGTGLIHLAFTPDDRGLFYASMETPWGGGILDLAT